MLLSVTDGHPALGKFTVTVGDALGIMLEDSPRRGKERLSKLMKARKGSPTGRLYIENTWPTVDDGGLQELENWIKDFPNVRLIVIDVLRRMLDVGYSYRRDAKQIQTLSEIGLKYHLAIVAVTHLYKGPAVSASSPDWVDKIAGSIGVSAAADCIIGLARERGTDEGVLRVVGKDVPEQNVPMTFNAETGVWAANDGGGEFASVLTEERQRIYMVIAERPGYTAAEVAAALGASYNSCRHLMWSMVQSHQLARLDGHYYTPQQVEKMEAPDANPQLSFNEKQRIDFVAGPLTQANGLALNNANGANRDNVQGEAA